MTAEPKTVHLVRALALLTAAVSHASSEGRAAEEEFAYPLAAVATEEGEVFVADRKLPGIWRIADGRRAVFHRASKKFRTPLNAVRCLAIDEEGRLLAGDSATRNVYRFTEDGEPVPLTKFPGDVEVPSYFGAIGIPMDVAVDADGHVFVADLELHRIWKIVDENEPPEEFAAVPAPRGLDVDSQGRLWVVSHGPNQVLRFDAAGEREVIVAGRPFRFPHDIAVTGADTAYVTDGYAKAVWKIEAGKKPSQVVAGKPLQNPVGITRIEDDLLVVDSRARRLFRLGGDGVTPFPSETEATESP